MGYKKVAYYDINTKKMIILRHVIHDEEVIPYKKRSVSMYQGSKESYKSN